MNELDDFDFYTRGIQTATRCWEAYARTISGGAVHRLPGVDVAVFVAGPERAVFNNAVLANSLGPQQRRESVEAMTATYADAGVETYAAWVHESDTAMIGELDSRGFTHQETTWAMGRLLDQDLPAPELRAAAAVGIGTWDDYLRVLELPPGLLTDADPAAFQVVVGTLEAEPVAAGMAFDHDGDAGIFNVGTLPIARRRGLGAAVVATLLQGAVARGNSTATLQSTAMARGVYTGQGFRHLGRILEFGPPVRR